MVERQKTVPFWLDERVHKILAQIAFLILVIALGTWAISNYLDRDLTFTFRFLREEASFHLAEGLPFSPTDPYCTLFWLV